MRLGVDLDNTIACYDGVFHAAAVARQWAPADLAPDKTSVRDFLRSQNREEMWTRLQGIVYGDEMHRAQPFAGVQRQLVACRDAGWDIAVISHRTRTPYLGPPSDLHAAPGLRPRHRCWRSP